MRISDWSSDVCSSDLAVVPGTMKTAMIESLGVVASTLPDDIAPTVAFLLDRRRSAPITGTLVDVHCTHDRQTSHRVSAATRELLRCTSTVVARHHPRCAPRTVRSLLTRTSPRPHPPHKLASHARPSH